MCNLVLQDFSFFAVTIIQHFAKHGILCGFTLPDAKEKYGLQEKVSGVFANLPDDIQCARMNKRGQPQLPSCFYT